MPTREIITEGWNSLVRNRLRSFLTMLGIVWGLVTVVLLLGYGQGVGQSVLSAFMGIGNNVVIMWGGQTSMQAGGERAGKRVRFKYEDVQYIREEVPLVSAVSAEHDDILGFKFNNRMVSVQTKAIQYPYGKMRRLDVEEGRYFEESDFVERRRVLVMGRKAAKKIFGTRPAAGEQVSVNGQSFTVIGVLRNKIQDASNNGPDNENVFLPFETYREITPVRDPGMMVFQASDPAEHEKVIRLVRASLARHHNFDPRDEKAVTMWNTMENVEELNQFSFALQVLLGLIGAMTLGVGGVGVMNIMLVSVTERTREIGLRKALGAKPKNILMQFLLEATVLTFIGGAIGMLLAVVLANVIPPMPLYSEAFKTANHEGDIFLRTSLPVMVSSFVILALVAISSGFYPAMKAARMDPVEALRYD
ncbi:MAG TPA: ABC transporter permease [Terriglobales bacterium]|nr:ABC transporter permease [Terriglobales bacterium]